MIGTKAKIQGEYPNIRRPTFDDQMGVLGEGEGAEQDFI